MKLWPRQINRDDRVNYSARLFSRIPKGFRGKIRKRKASTLKSEGLSGTSAQFGYSARQTRATPAAWPRKTAPLYESLTKLSVLYFIARTMCPTHPIKHSHAWKCTPVILTMSSPRPRPRRPAFPTDSALLSFFRVRRLYDCRTIGLKRYESLFIFLREVDVAEVSSESSLYID